MSAAIFSTQSAQAETDYISYNNGYVVARDSGGEKPERCSIYRNIQRDEENFGIYFAFYADKTARFGIYDEMLEEGEEYDLDVDIIFDDQRVTVKDMWHNGTTAYFKDYDMNNLPEFEKILKLMAYFSEAQATYILGSGAAPDDWEYRLNSNGFDELVEDLFDCFGNLNENTGDTF